MMTISTLTTRFLFNMERIMQKSALLRALQQEIRRHDFNYFVHEPPSIAQGGEGVVVPGCPACLKRINTINQFLDHLAEDAMPALIERLSTKDEKTWRSGPSKIALRSETDQGFGLILKIRDNFQKAQHP
jgi:hypothetical protein